MKTSKADFNKFKKSFLYWADKLDCNGYRFDFLHEKLDGSYAEISINEGGKAATISYNLEPSNKDIGPEQNGKHEALHLFSHRLVWLGEQRFTGPDEITHEWERLVRILEKIL